MPRGFDVPRGAQLWMPVVPILAASSPQALDNVGVLYMLGRLRPGVTRDAARDELERFIERASCAGAGDREPGTASRIVPFVDYSVGPVRQVLVGAARRRRRAAADQLCERVGLDARADVHPATRAWHPARARGDAGRSRARMDRRNRAARRRRRRAGARRRRTGSCARSSRWLPPTCHDSAEVRSIRLSRSSPPSSVIATALLCGVGPVRQAVSTNLVESVNETGRATGSLHTRRVRSALVAAQIGLSVVLLVASALMLRSFLNLRRPRPRLLSGGRADDERRARRMRSRRRANGSTIPAHASAADSARRGGGRGVRFRRSRLASSARKRGAARRAARHAGGVASRTPR